MQTSIRETTSRASFDLGRGYNQSKNTTLVCEAESFEDFGFITPRPASELDGKKAWAVIYVPQIWGSDDLFDSIAAADKYNKFEDALKEAKKCSDYQVQGIFLVKTGQLAATVWNEQVFFGKGYKQ